MIRSLSTPRRFAVSAAAALALTAACGDDDAAGGGGGGGGGGGDDSADTAGASDDDAAVASGEPSTLLADELHPLDLPEPGTAVVTLAGETYVFEALSTCRIAETAEGRWSFVAIGNGELSDGTRTRFDVSRYLVEADVWTEGDWHERDFLQMTVEQEPGADRFSNAIHDVTRDQPGGPITGDGDEMPVIRVIDDGGVVAATGVAEVSHPPFTGEYDRAGEGVGEFAVVCE